MGHLRPGPSAPPGPPRRLGGGPRLQPRQPHPDQQPRQDRLRLAHPPLPRTATAQQTPRPPGRCDRRRPSDPTARRRSRSTVRKRGALGPGTPRQAAFPGCTARRMIWVPARTSPSRLTDGTSEKSTAAMRSPAGARTPSPVRGNAPRPPPTRWPWRPWRSPRTGARRRPRARAPWCCGTSPTPTGPVSSPSCAASPRA